MYKHALKLPQALIFFIAIISAALSHAELRILDSIAAIVDNDVVMTSELNERVDSIYQRIQESGTELPPREVLVPQVLERLIIERIQLAMGQRAGIRITEAELNNAIAGIAQNQGMTEEQFVAQATQRGIPISAMKDQLTSEMIIARVQQAQVNRRIFVSDQEIDNFLESDEGRSWRSPDVNLGHILLPLSSAASHQQTEDAQNLAANIIQKVAHGEDFRSLAIANSGDQTALQGGDLGWRKLAQLPDVFIDALSAMSPGEVSKPIRSDAGIHILKLYEKRGSTEQIIQQSKVRHILLKPNEIRGDDATYKQLTDIAQQIRDGEDFTKLAKEHSEDIGSALSGGDVGWSLPGKFVPEFEQVLNNIPTGEISAPFRSAFGWHILQVTERRDQDFSADIRRNQAENILRQRKFEEELQIWLQEVRDEAFVEIKL